MAVLVGAILLFSQGSGAETAGGTAVVLGDLDRAYDEAMDSGLYGEAVDVQKQFTSTLRLQPGHSTREWGRALDRLAAAQALNGNYGAAIESYQLSVEVIEDAGNRLDEALASPLTGLARAQASIGDAEAALDTYKRAIHIQQVNFGPHAFQQAEALEEMCDIALELGNDDDANAYMQAYASLYRQQYEDDYIAQVDALLKQARVMARTGHYRSAKFFLRRIINDIEQAAGRRSLAVLPAIYDLVDIQKYDQVNVAVDGNFKERRYLRRAVYLVENVEEATPLDRADAYIAYGDYLSLHSADHVATRRLYQKAWAALSSRPEYLDARTERFGKPLLLNPVPLHTVPAMHKALRLEASAGNAVDPVRLQARYDIDITGNARNIAVVEGDPTGYMDPIVMRHIELFVFRPGFVDGQPVVSDGHRFELTYPAAAMSADTAAEIRQNGVGQRAD